MSDRIRDALATVLDMAQKATASRPNATEQELRLEQLAAIAGLVDAAEVARHHLVTELREPRWQSARWSHWYAATGAGGTEPTPWELIAKAQGLTKQGAAQRFKRSQPKTPAPVDPLQLTID